MSQYIIANPKAIRTENVKINLYGTFIPDEVEPVQDTEWYLLDDEHNFYLRLSLEYQGARNGGRRAYPTFTAPKWQAYGPLDAIMPGGQYAKGMEALHEAWERRDEKVGRDIWCSCYQRNNNGDLVPAGNGDYFHPERETFVPGWRMACATERMTLPNSFRRLAAGLVLGFDDGDIDKYQKIRSDARAQTLAYLRHKGVADPYEASLEQALDAMECTAEEELEVKLDTKGLAVHKFDFQFGSKELRSGALVLHGLANPDDEHNRVSIDFLSHNRKRMMQIFAKLGVKAE